jgi:triacylglycerol lipase
MAERLPRFTEGRAFAQQASLIARHGRRSEPPLAGKRAVVMVHGFLAASPVFDPLRTRLADELGWASTSFGYPSYGTFEATAERFAEALDRHVAPSTELILVGHSLGGILARWYVHELGGHARVTRVVTISTPHLGTPVARIAPFGLGAAIRPGSPVLARLAVARGGPSLCALAGAEDTTVPPESALGCNADEKHIIPDVGHNAILYAPHAQAQILDAIAGVAPGARALGRLRSVAS